MYFDYVHVGLKSSGVFFLHLFAYHISISMIIALNNGMSLMSLSFLEADSMKMCQQWVI